MRDRKLGPKGLAIVLPVVLAGCLGLVACDPTLGLTVTTTADGHDAAPGDGVCEMTAGVGDCSLRAAVEEGGTSSEAVHVSVPGATYSTGTNGPLSIGGSAASIVLQGVGPATIDGTGTTDVIDVHGHASLVGLVVTGGSVDGVHVLSGGQLDFAGSTAGTNARNGVEGNAGATVNVTFASLSNNGQAGLLSAGTTTLARSTVTGNGGVGGVGGVVVSGGATITDTTMSHNESAGLASINGTTVVSRSTIDHNQSSWACANAGCVGLGTGPGGIYVQQGSFALIDSTVTANTVKSPFDGTISDAGMQVGFATCGASCIFDFATAAIVSSTVDQQAFVVFGEATVAGSAMGLCRVSGLGGMPAAAKFTDGGGNVVVGTSCTFPTQLQVPDLLLGPLADNGGGTQTRLPTAGSPLLDHIPTGTAGLCDGSIPTDQRGVTRPQGSACDAGSVEVG